MYASMQDCVNDLEQAGQLLRIPFEVDGNLEAAEIHRRIFDRQGPAILFEKIKGSPFRALSNIYGTFDRTDFLFRKTMERTQRITEIKADFSNVLKRPFRYVKAPFTALAALPRKAWLSKPVKYGTTTIDQLPLIKSWPMDGGAFVTAPQVMTFPPGSQNIMQSNLGMYRIQLNGNQYESNKEIGMHYQLHRGIGVHHKQYLESDEDFKCSIFIGGPPSHAFSAIMPMPEGMSELTFAGMLGNKRFRYCFDDHGHCLSADADFVITGRIRKDLKKPEGPFGDHLGYYSLTHDFPVMEVDRVYHRKDAIWHFTVVGRPPMEDSSFGYLISKLVKELTPSEFPGLSNINAVDAAGVHPLLLAVGKERYMPWRDQKPEEILTIANRLLGSGQTSLAKFLIIAAEENGADVNAHEEAAFFRHFLERVDWRRDLHFQTRTTIDTLDYSGSGWNEGSKVVMACCGPQLRSLATENPGSLSLPDAFPNASVALPGILAISGAPFQDYRTAEIEMQQLAESLEAQDLSQLPLIVVCDDHDFLAQTLNNFLWVTFTRANPSHDLYGVKAYTQFKHWGCEGPLIIDARKKPFHAPELIRDPDIADRVNQYFKKGGALYNLI